MARRETDTESYHLQELSIANSPGHRSHVMPPITNRHRHILDVGCGAGQTLIASKLTTGVVACGIDIDSDALSLGRRIDAKIHFVRASGEAIPFRSDYFDLVVSRVALPFMNISRALAEMWRVLKDGGDLWVTLHPPSMAVKDLLGNLSRLELKGAAYRLTVLANGMALHFSGKQFRIPFSRIPYESCQTNRGVIKSLNRAGFDQVNIRRDKFFVVTAKKSQQTVGTPR
ncbi:MAG: class I SAM-dependent methyltransferase [Acidobacteriota bacterium]|nr:class I SAM-dependent methyltransferase [Acidobacteriota bacterium]